MTRKQRRRLTLTFTLNDLARFLKWPRSRVSRVAKELGLVTWNHRKTRITPFTCEQAKAIIAVKHMRSKHQVMK